ncbi:MAG: hypothetical protein QOK20_875, partial [Acidimicrobiaceae bacterium]|nr:hypothetical protein [Acidimicrobiaceae bacterium]
ACSSGVLLDVLLEPVKLGGGRIGSISVR